jgi:hypothetical protein
MNDNCVPVKFKVVECVTWLLVLLPIVFMFLDFFYSWTKLSSLFYLYASACGASLLVTAKIAKKKRKSGKENHDG